MVNYDEVCAFCNEVGEEMPEAITHDTEEPQLILLFCQFLWKLIEKRKGTPCVAYPESTAFIETTYTKLVRQWYIKPREEPEEEPVTFTMAYATKRTKKLIEVSCTFERAMIFTDILGSALDHDERLKEVRKWLTEEGHYTPSNMTELQILTDDKVLNIII